MYLQGRIPDETTWPRVLPAPREDHRQESLSLGHRADLERLTTLVVMGTGQKRSLQMDVFPANERQSKRNQLSAAPTCSRTKAIAHS